MIMFVPKQRKRTCKDQTALAVSVFSRPSSPSRDKEALEISRSFNSGSSSAVSQTPKYKEDNFQRILKIVLGVGLPLALDQDRGTSEDSPERAFKLGGLNVYKSK